MNLNNKSKTVSKLSADSSAISFSCRQDGKDAPEVVIRFITKGEPEKVVL
ncbi:MAG: hypothetical protein LUD46_03675 [Parabacteroides sp.]|nr:hypothetical protein [Parabacteroides sp.]